MSEPTTNEVKMPRRTGSRIGRTVLRLWIGFVALGILAIILLSTFGDVLSDRQWPELESGYVNVLTYFLILVSTFGGLCWVFLFSGGRWYTRLIWSVLILACASAPLVLFEPVFGGGLSLRGLRPRFWKSPSVVEQPSGIADLAPESSSDFPQFFGPNRDGKVFGIEFDTDWESHPPQLVWKKNIGPGWSGFATRNGFAVTMEQDGPRECVSCYRVADGSLVWNYCIGKRHENLMGGVGPRSTPTIHNGQVYALGAVGNLCCLDGATGKPIWERDVLQLANIPTSEHINGRGEAYTVEQSHVAWGRAASPLIFDSMVIVPIGGEHTLGAFDQQTGDVVWLGGHDQPSYSSPVVATIDGSPQIVIVNESTASGHEPKTGAVMWSWPWPGSSSGDANTSLATVVGNDQILLSKGYGQGAILLNFSRRNGVFPTILWSSQRVLRTKLTNAIVHEGSVFAISNEVLECVDLQNGERRWRAPMRYGHGQVLMVGDSLLAHTEDGYLVLAEAGTSRYHEWGRIKTIDGVCWNTISMFGDCVLVRSDSEAACFRLAMRTSKNSTKSASTAPVTQSEPRPREAELQ